MQAVILAAGKGTRMGNLTESMPKAMLEVAGKPLLEHKLEALPAQVEDVVLIIGYFGGVIHDYFGGIWKDKKILYVEQDDPTGGTADALWQAKDLLTGRFLVMNGDGLYATEDMEACLAHPDEWAVVVQKTDHVRTGAVVVNGHGRVKGIAESTEHKGGPGYVNTGLYGLDTRIFGYEPVAKAAGSKERGLPQTMMQAADEIFIRAIPATYWNEVKDERDLAQARSRLARP